MAGTRRDMTLVRTKNNFAPEYDALHESFGYRSILTNILFKLPVTWEALIKEEDGETTFLPRIFEVGAEIITKSSPRGYSRGQILDCQNGIVHVKDCSGDNPPGPWTLPASEVLALNADKLRAGSSCDVCLFVPCKPTCP